MEPLITHAMQIVAISHRDAKKNIIRPRVMYVCLLLPLVQAAIPSIGDLGGEICTSLRSLPLCLSLWISTFLSKKWMYPLRMVDWTMTPVFPKDRSIAAFLYAT